VNVARLERRLQDAFRPRQFNVHVHCGRPTTWLVRIPAVAPVLNLCARHRKRMEAAALVRHEHIAAAPVLSYGRPECEYIVQSIPVPSGYYETEAQ
jgi:hypothetical protein